MKKNAEPVVPAAQRSRRRLAIFPRHLRHEISAHRISREKDLRESVALRQLLKNRAIVSAHSGVIKRWSQRLRPTAIPLVQSHHMKPALKSLFRDAKHIIRIARALQPMHNRNHRRVFSLSLLPVTRRKQLRILRNAKEPRLRPRQCKPPRPIRRGNGHRMPVAQPSMRLKSRSIHARTVFDLEPSHKMRVESQYGIRRTIYQRNMKTHRNALAKLQIKGGCRVVNFLSQTNQTA